MRKRLSVRFSIPYLDFVSLLRREADSEVVDYLIDVILVVGLLQGYEKSLIRDVFELTLCIFGPHRYRDKRVLLGIDSVFSISHCHSRSHLSREDWSDLVKEVCYRRIEIE